MKEYELIGYIKVHSTKGYAMNEDDWVGEGSNLQRGTQ